jgi:hypothetical protein
MPGIGWNWKPGTGQIPLLFSTDSKGSFRCTTGNPHTTRPLINQSSCTGEHVEIKWSGLKPWSWAGRPSHRFPCTAAFKTTAWWCARLEFYQTFMVCAVDFPFKKVQNKIAAVVIRCWIMVLLIYLCRRYNVSMGWLQEWTTGLKVGAYLVANATKIFSLLLKYVF